MALPKITDFYRVVQCLSTNITSKFHTVTTFKRSNKQTTIHIKNCVSMTFYCFKLHLSKRNGSELSP
jgi:hypothetical protein